MMKPPYPIKPDLILVEPAYQPKTEGGLHLPDPNQYPTSGFIYGLHRNYSGELKVGDFVVIEEHGIRVDNYLNDTFIIRARDGAGEHIIRADRDIEPWLNEVVPKVRAGRFPNKKIVLHDLNRDREPVSLLLSEIVDFGIGSYTESGYNLSYRHHTLIHPADTGLDHPTLMLVPERELLFFIRREDLTQPSEADNG